jgi:hypothetical protein
MATRKTKKKTLENMTRIFFGPKFGSYTEVVKIPRE